MVNKPDSFPNPWKGTNGKTTELCTSAECCQSSRLASVGRTDANNKKDERLFLSPIRCKYQSLNHTSGHPSILYSVIRPKYTLQSDMVKKGEWRLPSQLHVLTEKGERKPDNAVWFRVAPFSLSPPTSALSGRVVFAWKILQSVIQTAYRTEFDRTVPYK